MPSHRRLSRLAVLPIAALGLLAAAPAFATTHYFCYLRDAYSDRGFYFTPVMATSEERLDETDTGFKFSEYASKAGYSIEAGSIQTGCLSSTNADYVREQHSHYPEWYPGMQEIAWPEPPVPAAPVEESPVTDGLVIEEPDPPKLTPEMMAANALAQQRKEAANLAKAKAEHARLDAELEVKLRESLERARRRGRMQ